MSKITLRIPAKEQYAYIEIEIPSEFTPAEVKETYDLYTGLMKGEQSVSELAFNTYLIELMNSDLTKPLNAEFYESLTKSQVDVVQSIKRFKKRLSVIEE